MANEEPDQKDVDAFFAYLTRIEQESSILEKGLHELIDWLSVEKEKYLPDKKLQENEKQFYQTEIDRLEGVIRSLKYLEGAVTDTALKADIWHMGVNAFIAGINLGQYGEPIEAIKSIFFVHHARDMAANKTAKAQMKILKRREIIKEQYKGKLSKSETCAKNIIDSLAPVFEKEVLAFSPATIQRDISAILSERVTLKE